MPDSRWMRDVRDGGLHHLVRNVRVPARCARRRPRAVATKRERHCGHARRQRDQREDARPRRQPRARLQKGRAGGKGGERRYDRRRCANRGRGSMTHRVMLDGDGRARDRPFGLGPVHTMSANANGWHGAPIEALDEAKTGCLCEESNEEWRSRRPVPFGLLPKWPCASLRSLARRPACLRLRASRMAISVSQRVSGHSVNRP